MIGRSSASGPGRIAAGVRDGLGLGDRRALASVQLGKAVDPVGVRPVGAGRVDDANGQLGQMGRNLAHGGVGQAHMTTRAGFIALIGEPNAGKSTLLNRMVGAKVSIVTHKVQTTRARIRGVAMEGDAQIVFVDTPGLFRPRRRLDRAMVAAAWGGAADADVVVLLIEAHRGLTEGVEAILDALGERTKGRRVALAINKIDRVEAPVLLG
jgi:small GTP-binding protein